MLGLPDIINHLFFWWGHINPQQSQPDMGKFSAVRRYALGLKRIHLCVFLQFNVKHYSFPTARVS